MKTILSAFRSASILLLLLTLLLGFVYPLTVMAFAQLLFHDKAEGSLIERGGKVVGSELLGQQFGEAKYFWGRLSATTPPYNAAASGGSNLSVNNPKLLEAVNVRLSQLQRADPDNRERVPIDLVTASASGLDPHISVEAAQYQAARVARARGLKPDAVQQLITDLAASPTSGLLGDPYVNVLELNLALDKK
jgi:K+-transporting ATPase ATPase C chain